MSAYLEHLASRLTGSAETVRPKPRGLFEPNVAEPWAPVEDLETIEERPAPAPQANSLQPTRHHAASADPAVFAPPTAEPAVPPAPSRPQPKRPPLNAEALVRRKMATPAPVPSRPPGPAAAVPQPAPLEAQSPNPLLPAPLAPPPMLEAQPLQPAPLPPAPSVIAPQTEVVPHSVVERQNEKPQPAPVPETRDRLVEHFHEREVFHEKALLVEGAARPVPPASAPVGNTTRQEHAPAPQPPRAESVPGPRAQGPAPPRPVPITATRKTAPEAVIELTIGRIEVRANQSPAKPKPLKKPPRQTVLSLDDHLARLEQRGTP